MSKLTPFILFVVIFVFSLSACSPSESSIATAIAQTQIAQPSPTSLPTQPPTSTPIPTDTPTPTFTPLPTLTSTPTATLIPTPDLRVIDIDPKQFLMTVDDLPKEGKYYLPNSNWISPHRNSEVVSGWGVEEGRKYLEETGRIDGWWVNYKRGSNTVNLPDEFYDGVVMYKSSEGASLLISKYSDCINADGSSKDEYIPLSNPTELGVDSVFCMKKEMQSNGKNKVEYNLEFVFRNYFHNIIAWGWEYEVTPEMLVNVANNLLAKLEVAPLSRTITYTP